MSRPAARAVSVCTVAAVACRPALWSTAVQQAARLVPRRRSRSGAESYVDFRLHTQYGNGAATVSSRQRAADVLSYLRWCREWNTALRHERGAAVFPLTPRLTRRRPGVAGSVADHTDGR